MMPHPTMNEALPQSFHRKKQKILAQLSLPSTEYDDLSPKGSVDEGIRDLIDEINGREGLITTSSCGGRVSVFLEGKRNDDEGNNEITGKSAGVGGKGGGGRWLYVAHESVEIDEMGDSISKFLGMERRDAQAFPESGLPRRLIHFKFEPMILHILAGSLSHAQLVLTAAHQAGFRESGALNLTNTTSNEPPTPMVGVRTMGLALESIIGFSSGTNEEVTICFVPEEQLRILVETANTRFIENTKRIARFRQLLNELFSRQGQDSVKVKPDGTIWEDAATRKERMRAEGLRKAEELKLQRGPDPVVGNQTMNNTDD